MEAKSNDVESPPPAYTGKPHRLAVVPLAWQPVLFDSLPTQASCVELSRRLPTDQMVRGCLCGLEIEHEPNPIHHGIGRRYA